MTSPPVSSLASPITSFANRDTVLEHRWNKLKNKKKTKYGLYKKHLKKIIKFKTFPQPTNISFHATICGVTAIQNIACFETMEDYAYVMFTHSFSEGQVNLSITVTGLDGTMKPVYNLADVKHAQFFVNAVGGTKPRKHNCHIIAAHFCNDINGNPHVLVCNFT